MGDSVPQSVDAVDGLYELVWLSAQMGECVRQGCIPQVPAARVTVGEQESPRAERQLSE